MRIYTYILEHDTGFAPNPFHGWCTLAGCKPVIRKTAKVGDWIVGITPHDDGNRVAYAMTVAEALSFPQYWKDSRFKAKRQREKSHSRVKRRGDNINPSRKHDLSGKQVLVARRFCYQGAEAFEFPSHLAAFATPGRFYRVKFTDTERAKLLAFLEALPQGVHGRPRDWPEDDDSWRPKRRRKPYDVRRWTEQPRESYELIDEDGTMMAPAAPCRKPRRPRCG